MAFITETISDTFKRVSSTVIEGIKYIWEEHKAALFVTTAVVTAFKFHHSSNQKKLRNREDWDSAGEDVVVLHTIPAATTCPNLSPFILKLETYMRMAGIKYTQDISTQYGPKGKFPWITLNGKDYTDSQLIIELLGKKFNKDFSSHLNEEHKAIARAMLIMNDEHLFWGLVWWRFIKDPDHRVSDLMKANFSLQSKGKYGKFLRAQGIGRHSDEEIVEIIRKDIESISNYLGNQKFLLGDNPCEVDCAIFGLLTQFVWGTPGSPFELMLQTDYKNLQEYCFRMKEKFWPDWDEALAGSVKFIHSIGC